VPTGPSLLLTLAPAVTVVEGDAGRWRLVGPPGVIALPAQPAGFVAAARALAVGATEDKLAAAFLAVGGSSRAADGPVDPEPAALMSLSLRLRLWWGQGFLRANLVVAGAPMATLVPMGRGVPLPPRPVEASVRWRLSRFAYLRRDDDVLLADAQAAAGIAEPPQVLITLASRFQRLSWKYAAMAYATTLKTSACSIRRCTSSLRRWGWRLAPWAAGTRMSSRGPREPTITPSRRWASSC